MTNIKYFFSKYLKLEEEHGTQNIYLWIFSSYIFVVVLKFIILYFKYNGLDAIVMQNGEYIPILHPDAGLYGYFAKNILNGVIYPMSANYMPGHLLAFIVKITQFSLNQVLFSLSIFLSSLIVAPILIFGYMIKMPKLALYTAILGVFSSIYDIRNGFGYYDTDSLNVVFTMMIAIFMSLSLKKDSILYVVLAILSVFMFEYWYHSYKAIVLFLVCMYILHVFLFAKNALNYQLILPLLISIAPFSISSRLIMIAILLVAIFFQNKNKDLDSKRYIKYLRYAVIIFSTVAIIYLFLDPIYYQRALDYFSQDKSIVFTQSNGNELYFSNELADVAEASAKSLYNTLHSLFIGSYFTLFLSFSGLLILLFQNKNIFIIASLSIFFFIALQAGIRFGMFGIFALMLGVSYWICKIEDIIRNKHILLAKASIAIFIFTLFLFSYRIYSSNSYLTLNKDDIKILKQINSNANDRDFMLSSWSYGWYMWYFTKFHTIIDNGKHFHDKYIIAKLLLSKQVYTAFASRYFFEQCENRSCRLSLKLYKNKTIKQVDEEITNVEKTKDIYFFLHERMLLSMNAIILDLQVESTNKVVGAGRYFSSKIHSLGKKISSKHFIVNQVEKSITVLSSNKSVKFHTLFAVNNDGSIRSLKGHSDSNFYAIVYKSRYLIVLHKDILNSFFIQAYIFNDVNQDFFKIVGKTPTSKIIKLRI